MKQAETIVKMMAVPEILKAAVLLHSKGLIPDPPASYVKKYLQDNPDVGELINKEIIK
jgi:hypothetical protein